MIFGSSLRAMMKNEISSDENGKEAFRETAFRCVNATHRVTPFPSVFIVITQFSGDLQWDTFERNEDYRDKGNIFSWKLERSFHRTFLVMCEFISQIYTYISCNSPLSLFLRNLRRTSFDCIETYADKGNIISSTWKKLSEKLLCDVWIPLPELQLSSWAAVC